MRSRPPLDALRVRDGDGTVSLTFADVLRFHGSSSPGGVAHAFQVLQRGLPVLCPDEPCDRRAVAVRTAFPGPGARDAFECVLLAVREGRYVVDPALAREDLPPTRRRFVFRLEHCAQAVTLTLRDGFVTDEFVALLAVAERSMRQEARLTRLKQEMADRVMAAPAAEVYDAAPGRR